MHFSFIFSIIWPNKGFITATDLADYLVKNHSMSFRKAYQKKAEIVNLAEKKKKKL